MSQSSPNPGPILEPIDVPLQRKRFIQAMSAMVICIFVALAALVAYFGFHIGWMIWVFGAAALAGFGAQGWLIAGLAGKRKA